MRENNLLIGAEVTEKLKQEELLLTKPVREHSCTMHSTGDRWGTEKCLACAYEAGAKAQLAEVKQDCEQKVRDAYSRGFSDGRTSRRIPND